MQARIHALQNPTNCSSARLLVCELNWDCGFAIELHVVAYYLQVAAASNRTLVLHKNGAEWRYASRGWESIFLPISSCNGPSTTGLEFWNRIEQPARVVRCPSLWLKEATIPAHAPKVLPTELASALVAAHGDPHVFVVGQLKHYLMQMQPSTKAVLAQAEKEIFAGANRVKHAYMVGLHIRRSDKVGTESSYYPVEEYMRWIDYRFRVKQRQLDRATASVQSTHQPPPEIHRQLYVATDDPTVVEELRSKYPNYEVYSNSIGSATAQLTTRYSDASLLALLVDIHVLSTVDYLVCTFSSGVSRTAYELMQVGHADGDKSGRYHSLDFGYVLPRQQDQEVVAVEAHHITGDYRFPELEMEAGDTIVVDWNMMRVQPEHLESAGWNRGTNRRTGILGFFPRHKVLEKAWRTASFPLFAT